MKKHLLLFALLLLTSGAMFGQEGLPTVITDPVSIFDQNTATCGGRITDNGGSTIEACGVSYSTTHGFEGADGTQVQSSNLNDNIFTVDITGLEPGTTYYVRAYATNSTGTAYGSEVSFTTSQPSVVLPSVTTNQVSNIQQTSATGGGTITNDGGGTISAYGVSYSTTSGFQGQDGIQVPGSNLNNNSFTVNITGLEPGTTYYVRAYATNSAGTAYGNEVSFTTSQPSVVPPSVTTNQVTNITQNSATGGGNVINNGGAIVTERGICWGTSHNPTTSGTHQNSGTGNGAFMVNMTNLMPGTTYYVRAYAINSAGTAYGDEVQFTTLQEATLPSVITNQVSNIQQTSATGSGTVTSDGGAPVTERGICWSTEQNPDINGSHAEASSGGMGSFTVEMTNLTPNQIYYVRAYAKNSAGINYGNELYFITSILPLYEIVVKANPQEGGELDGGGTYQDGQTCNVKAMANLGYDFINWTEDGDTVYNEPNYSFIVRANRTLIANFEKQKYTITVNANPSDGGIVTGGGSYEYGEYATLTATPASGYEFKGWSDGFVEPVHRVLVTSDATYTAYFKESIPQYTVTVSASDGGTAYIGETPGTTHNTFNNGDSCTVHAVANDGFSFVNWTEDNVEVSTDVNYTFLVNGNRTLIANFEQEAPNQYTITVSASDGGTAYIGETPGTLYDTFNIGDSCTVHAVANDGFSFVNWTEDNVEVSTDVNYTFPVKGNHTLVANFEQEAPTQYTITVTASPEEGGTVTGGNSYPAGERVTVTATANEGYTFVNWTENGNEVSTNDSYTFTVDSDRNLVANFKGTPCIEDLREIEDKEYVPENSTDTIILILVYPNFDTENYDKYEYQWYYSIDGVEKYTTITERNKKPYYYKQGGVDNGFYKVEIYLDDCSVTTNPHQVTQRNHNTPLHFYPNPSRRGNSITVVNDCNGPAQLRIYSTDGRLLHTQTVTGNEANIGISLLPGVYVAYLTNSEGYTKVGKLIIH